MKTLLGTLILLFAVHTATMAHRSEAKEENLEENREGTFLKEMNIRLDTGYPNPTQKYSVILKKGINYAFYLSNSSTSINNVILSVYKNKEEGVESYPLELKTEVNAKENYSVSRLKPDETGPYHLFIQFDEQNKQNKQNHVTMSIYYEE